MADMMIPEGWRISKIGDTCHILDSKRIPLNSQERATRQGAYPYYGANGIQGYIDDFIFEGEHVLLAEDGGYFDEWDSRPISYLVNGKFWVNNHAHILRAKKGHETKYVHYSLVHKNILKHINGGTRAKLNQSDMREIAYLTPPLPEQQKIATILSSVDTVIEKTRAQIDKLKHLKTGMMQQLLTQGIGHTEFKNTPIGRIPKEWDVAAIADIARLTSGGTPNRENSDYWNGDVLWVKTGEVNYQTILDTEEKITVLGLKESSAKLVPAGAILMAMYGQGITRGKVAKLGVPAAMNQACLAMIPNNQVINDFLYYFLSREYFNLRSMVQEGAQKNLSASIVKEILLPVPPRKEQQKIVDVLQSIDTKIMTASQKLISVEQTKKALMQDLLTGKVRVETTARC